MLTNYQGGPQGGPTTISIPTTERDIGIWGFRLTATDNENEQGTPAEIEVNVRNLPPKITLDKPDRFTIKAGEDIVVTNLTPDDPDGGSVTHIWMLYQAPVAAGVTPNGSIQTGTSPTLRLTNPAAGTWVFALYVQDNENEARLKDFQVLVDAPPKAVINGVSKNGAQDMLMLDGGGSVDPDSPPPSVPNRGHVSDRDEGIQEISDGIISYQWSLVGIPQEYFPRYLYGPVDYSLHIAGNPARLEVPSNTLEPGSWTFQLEVEDGEGNRDSTTHTVLIGGRNTPPIPIVSAPRAFLTDLAGVPLVPINLDGSYSVDLDNLVSEDYVPGLGIKIYDWEVVNSPLNCSGFFNRATGPTVREFSLFPPSTAIPLPCLGAYGIQLTVTDDDQPALSEVVKTGVWIGNCNAEICIDYPRTDNYQYVEFSENTDVIIYYHLNAGIYPPLFSGGVKVELSLYHESDLLIPVYSGQVDYDVLTQTLGGYPTAHWHGFTNGGTRPRPGKYTIRMRAVDSVLPTPYSEAVQSAAIWIEVLDVAIASSSDTHLSLNRVATGNDSLRLAFTATGYCTTRASFDEAWLHIRLSANPSAILGSVRIPSPTIGVFNWNGELAFGVLITPGHYTAEVEIRKAGRTLGTSPGYAFTAFRVDIQVEGTPASSKQTPGVVLDVNGTPKDVTVTLEPSSLDGDVALRTSGNPGSTEIKDGPTVLNTDGPTGVTQAASGFAVPKVFAVKMLTSTVSPTRFDVTYSPVVSPLAKDASDFIKLNAKLPGVVIKDVTYSGASFHNVAKDTDGLLYPAPQWTDSGINVPISYTRSSIVSVSARFELAYPISGATIIVKGEGTGGLHVEGPASSAGSSIIFPTTAFAQGLPGTIQRFDPFEIRWQVSLDNGTHFLPAGTSRNKMYVTLSNPGPLAVPLYETILDIGTTNGVGLDTAAAVVSAIWMKFTTLLVTRVDGTVMGYWTGPGTCQSMQMMLRDAGGDKSCVAWAQLFHQVLEGQGITGSQIFKIVPYDINSPGADQFMVKNWKFGSHIRTGPNGLNESTRAGDDVQIVSTGTVYPDLPAIGPGPDGTLDSISAGDDVTRDGSFAGTAFPYWVLFDVVDQIGIPGQRNLDPPRSFENHWVVKYAGQIYDPSYGAGPFATEREHQNAAIDGISAGARAKKNDPSVKLLDYQRDAARE